MTIYSKKITSSLKLIMPIKLSEHEIQKSFFQFLSIDPKFKPLISRKAIIAIPNGGKRNIITAIKLKKEGVTPGVFDVFCTIAKGPYHGLWIEFKAGYNKLTDEQKLFSIYRSEDDFKCVVCYSAEEAIAELNNYLYCS